MVGPYPVVVSHTMALQHFPGTRLRWTGIVYDNIIDACDDVGPFRPEQPKTNQQTNEGSTRASIVAFPSTYFVVLVIMLLARSSGQEEEQPNRRETDTLTDKHRTTISDN